ncbi:M56 family metallopeptidase [Gilvimarinus chinensis]|uniref:M56 family metallopeptidase n=1 Tax=Gilvimarinus chinensis TaxID=396005 RepID=UPI000365DAEB|nr:M56 family metallopeptidase [Gilvimarinus chinensis]
MSALFAPLSQWLMLWVFTLLLLRAVYPLVRRYLMSLHPADSAVVQLTLYSVPAVLSAALVWAVNGGAGGLLLSHCHGTICDPHRPDIQYPLALLLLGALLLTGLLARVFWVWQGSRRYASQLLQLAKRRGEWWVLPTTTPTVFTLGFWRCKLVASQGLLTALPSAALEIIADHERAHRQRGDNLRTLIARVALLPLLPLCRPLLEDLDLNHEKACDLAACHNAEPTQVAQTIIDVARLQQKVQAPNNASFFAHSHTQARVKALLSSVPARGRRIAPITAVCLTSLAVFSLSLDPLHHLLEWLW